MCQADPANGPRSLHEIFCQTSHGLPCKAAHAISRIFSLITGRTPKPSCCDAGNASTCGCHDTSSRAE